MDRTCQLEALARAALNLLLLGRDPVLAALRRQASVSEWAATPTGCGFRAEFHVLHGHPPLAGEPSFEVTDVYAELPGTEHIVNFALFVRSGRLAMLEGATTDASWPEDLDGAFLLYNTRSGIRDLAVFMASLRSAMRYPAT